MRHLDPHRIFLNLKDKINLKSSDKYVVLSKNSDKNNKFKISGQTRNEEFHLPQLPSITLTLFRMYLLGTAHRSGSLGLRKKGLLL